MPLFQTQVSSTRPSRNRTNRLTLPDPPTSSTTRSQPYGRPIRTTSTAEQAESRASSEYLAIHTLFDAGSSMSINSLAHFVKQAAPGFFKLTSSTTPTSFHNDAESLIEEALTEQATIALPCPVPPRGPSLLNLRILEAGLASRVRRPLFSDIDDDTMSLVTHHTNLIPTTFEIGIATAVRLYRPPPVRLIVVHGRVVAMDPPVNAPWDTRSGGKDGCTGRSHFWSKLKRKFRCA